MAKYRKIGKGKNAFTVSQSDYDNGFQSRVCEIKNVKTGIVSIISGRGLKKEVDRIESIKKVKKDVKV